MSSISGMFLFTGNLRLGLRPEGAAEATTETLQQTDPCSCLSHSGIQKILKQTNNTAGGLNCLGVRVLLLRLSFHITLTFFPVWHTCWHEILCNQYIAIFTPLQTSWRCFAVENYDSATFKLFLRKKSSIPASSLSTPKPKKSVSNHFIDSTVTVFYAQFPVY